MQMDAILAVDGATGRPVEPAWPDADVIIGNPPFLGGQKLLRELGSSYVKNLRYLYEGSVPGGADLVLYWFERARALIDTGNVERAGLIATQAIRAGINRRILQRINETGNIFMAWADRPWVLDGANVRVSMVAFDNKHEPHHVLNGQPVTDIHSNLSSEIDLTLATSLNENLSLCFRA